MFAIITSEVNKVKKLGERLFQKKIRSKEDFLSECYERYGQKLCAYGKHSWKLPEDEAWDLTYKTLYRVVEVAPKYQFESQDKFRSFVFTTFINYIKNHFRDQKQLIQVPLEDRVGQLGTSETKEASKPHPKLLALEEILESLEDWQRILVLMRSDGRSYAEIAEFVDKPEKQLKVYYQRIKEQIKKRLYEE
ncbi:MAG: sigma-70 family RNA polymerase sigma factor [Bacteroidetes bacterium]|nr:MAG: sigma-70 family RNA polymerase sigma factor [Bacteroidota bacterium]